MTYKHKHHIVPKHAGGTDDPSNLVELSVAEHAEAHRLLYEEFGRPEDYTAYRGLLGEIGKEQIINEARLMGARKGVKTLNEGIKSGKYKKPSTSTKEFQKYRSDLALLPEAKAKRLETFKKIGHQQGENNSAYGKRWIHSLDEKRSKMIEKTEPLPYKWYEGRKMKFP